MSSPDYFQIAQDLVRTANQIPQRTTVWILYFNEHVLRIYRNEATALKHVGTLLSEGWKLEGPGFWVFQNGDGSFETITIAPRQVEE